MGADSTSREESEAWRDEDLMRLPVHPEYQGNLSFDCFWGSSSLLVVIFVALAGVGAGLTYYVTTTNSAQESVTPQSYLLNSYIPLSFIDRMGASMKAGCCSDCVARRPSFSVMVTIRIVPICCHSGRYCVTTTYNVYIFNFDGPKAREAFSDLGSRQASDLIAAIEIVTRQPDVNPNRVGVFGTSVGGYAAWWPRRSNPKVKALVVDTTYTTPESMFDSQIEHLLGGSSGVFHVLTEAEFHLATHGRCVLRHAGRPAQARECPQAFYFRAR